ncbi:hypothetical protein Syun_005239 [Stephania yunnanensis]|uniref:TF-B3 domain-containing protein n=1 Tax=Stephania yunnanensis TaxID=152371 RepID=A0AAP0L4D2_9MAGN
MRHPPSTSPSATAHAPHFFKIIHSDMIDEGRLRIPTKFTSNFPNGLSDVAKLSVPGGKIWDIKLKKYGDGMWFEKGLREFIKYYFINAGHLLLFRYDGNSKFHVIIFDTSATEIGYSFSNAAVDVGSELHKKRDGLKSSKGQVEHAEKATKPFAGKVRSQFEKRTGKLEIIEVSDGDTDEACEVDGTIETSEDDYAFETSEDDDDPIEILDVATFHKNVCRDFNECEEQGMRKSCGQRNKVDDPKYKKEDEGKQCTFQSQRRRFSLRTLSNKTTEVASSRLHKLASTSSKCNHLFQCKKEVFESKGKEKQLSDEYNRRQIRSRNMVIGNCGENGTKSQQLGVLSRSVANGTKSSVGDGSQHYQLQNRSVSCSGHGSWKLNPHRQYEKEQISDVVKAGQLGGEGKRSRITHDGSKEFCSAKLIWSSSDSSRRIDDESVYPYPCKKFKSSQELGLPVICSEKTRGLNKVRNRGAETFKINVKKEVLEMQVKSFEKIQSELAERRHSEKNSLVFHCPKDQSSMSRTGDMLITNFMNNANELPTSSSWSKLNPCNDKLLKACNVKADGSKRESPIRLLNKTIGPDNIPMTVKSEAGDLMPFAVPTSGNACFQVTMRHSYVNDTFRLSRLSASASGWEKLACELRCYKASNPRLIHGWKEFVIDNHLKEHDVCVFRVVEKEPNVIKVVILRCNLILN